LVPIGFECGTGIVEFELYSGFFGGSPRLPRRPCPPPHAVRLHWEEQGLIKKLKYRLIYGIMEDFFTKLSMEEPNHRTLAPFIIR
jgi:hypothetical protein